MERDVVHHFRVSRLDFDAAEPAVVVEIQPYAEKLIFQYPGLRHAKRLRHSIDEVGFADGPLAWRGPADGWRRLALSALGAAIVDPADNRLQIVVGEPLVVEQRAVFGIEDAVPGWHAAVGHDFADFLGVVSHVVERDQLEGAGAAIA